MTGDLSRLLHPKTVAVIGGGAWCRSVIAQLQKFGKNVAIWPVHPRNGQIQGISAYKDILDLPSPPDAAFVGINRDATILAVAGLSAMGSGGAVCFASGFAETEDGADHNHALLAAAGDMPILGPNCYGYINALDAALLWPDQHGCVPVESGVAILTQSSNIAINLSMQQRALPLAFMITCGNQAQTTQAEIALSLLDDPRVTAIGLHIEGFGDLRQWQTLAIKARDRKIPIVAIKVGRSGAAQAAAVSHTASLAGSDAGAQALLDRLGIARVDDLPTFLETLKLLHHAGHLNSNRIATISCSGGEASLAADIASNLPLKFPELNERQRIDLGEALGPKVALANPLDYHTYIRRDTKAMTRVFSAVIDPELALTMLIVDFPRPDRCDVSDWDCAVAAAIEAKKTTGGNLALVSTLPECLPETIAAQLIDGGVLPMHGLREALGATVAAQKLGAGDLDLALSQAPKLRETLSMSEADAKSEIAEFGLTTPRGATAKSHQEARKVAVAMKPPLAVKGTGFEHKSEHGAVRLNLNSDQEVFDAAQKMNAPGYLIEEMVTGPVFELLVGVICDPAHGFVMTIGAGGTMAEIMRDTQNLLVPSSESSLRQALGRLNCYPVLCGYRGEQGADIDAIISALRAIQDYVLANADRVAEVEVNPLICTKTAAVAADTLVRIANEECD